MDKKIGIFSFFSGAGFLDLGFEKTKGYDVLFVNEYYKAFADIYSFARKNLKIDPPVFGHQVDDISVNLENKNFSLLKDAIKSAKKTYDLVGFIGGPPCPDFSVAGKNMGSSGENGKLSGTYIDLICKAKPDLFLFENVKGLYRTKKHREFFEEIKLKLIDSGYMLTEKLINALEFGAPQDRERIILIGFKRKVLKDLGFKLNGSPIIKDFDWQKGASFKMDKILLAKWPGLEKFNEDSTRKKPDGNAPQI